jgi:hypothetical protein
MKRMKEHVECGSGQRWPCAEMEERKESGGRTEERAECSAEQR